MFEGKLIFVQMVLHETGKWASLQRKVKKKIKSINTTKNNYLSFPSNKA